MKPPVEHVRVSAKGKEILIKIKRRIGLEHWNEVCRLAICLSLSNPSPPPNLEKFVDSNIDIEWKTFAGNYRDEIAALIAIRGKQHGVKINNQDEIAKYFRRHMERGIVTLNNFKDINSIICCYQSSPCQCNYQMLNLAGGD